MARSYRRDKNGRFAGGGGSSGGRSRPAAKSVSRGTNRLTRDNAGKITGTGNGATARGGRLRTAAGNQRATQTARAKGGARAGVIKGRVARNPGALSKAGAGAKQAAPKVRFDNATQRRRAIRNQTNPGIREAYAKQGGKKPTPLEAKKVQKAYQTAGKARAYYSTATRDRIVHTPTKPTPKPRKQTRKLTRQTPGTIKGTVKRNPQAGAKLAARGKGGPLAGAAAKLSSDLATAKGAAAKAGARVMYKSAVRRAIKTDRSSVIPANPTGPKRVKLAKPGSTIARPRTQGNSTAVVSGRVQRRLAAATANLKNVTRYGNAVYQRQYDKLLTRERTLKRAANYLRTKKLPGKNNSIAKQREFKAAVKKLDAKNKVRKLARRVRR